MQRVRSAGKIDMSHLWISCPWPTPLSPKNVTYCIHSIMQYIIWGFSFTLLQENLIKKILSKPFKVPIPNYKGRTNYFLAIVMERKMYIYIYIVFNNSFLASLFITVNNIISYINLDVVAHRYLRILLCHIITGLLSCRHCD